MSLYAEALIEIKNKTPTEELRQNARIYDLLYIYGYVGYGDKGYFLDQKGEEAIDHIQKNITNDYGEWEWIRKGKK